MRRCVTALLERGGERCLYWATICVYEKRKKYIRMYRLVYTRCVPRLAASREGNGRPEDTFPNTLLYVFIFEPEIRAQK